MKADIIIPVFNASDVTWRSLCQLLLFHSPRDFHVILVDDCSTDDTPLIGQWIERLGGTYVRNETNLGPHGAWNAGAAAAKTDTFIFLNNDVLVGPGVLDGLTELAAEAGFGCVLEDQPPTKPTGAFFLEKLTACRVPLLTGDQLPGGVSYGSLFSVTRRAWADGVDAAMRIALADVDLIYRVRDSGYTPTVEKGLRVFHIGHQTRIRTLDPGHEAAQIAKDHAHFAQKWSHKPDILARHSPNPREEDYLRQRNVTRG